MPRRQGPKGWNVVLRVADSHLNVLAIHDVIYSTVHGVCAQECPNERRRKSSQSRKDVDVSNYRILGSVAHSLVDDLSAADALYPPVKQTKANAEGEPEDGREDTCDDGSAFLHCSNN